MDVEALVTICFWNTNVIMVGDGWGMDARVTVCSRNTKIIEFWAWRLWSPYAFGTRALLWLGMVGAWMLGSPYALVTRQLLNFGHGGSGRHMLLEHERYYGWGMDALVTVCFWNTNVIMVWAWMLWSPYALGTRKFMAWA